MYSLMMVLGFFFRFFATEISFATGFWNFQDASTIPMNIRFFGMGTIESLAAPAILGTTTGGSPSPSVPTKAESNFSPVRLYIVPRCLVALSGTGGWGAG